jgi:hypothetical protein
MSHGIGIAQQMSVYSQQHYLWHGIITVYQPIITVSYTVGIIRMRSLSLSLCLSYIVSTSSSKSPWIHLSRHCIIFKHVAESDLEPEKELHSRFKIRIQSAMTCCDVSSGSLLIGKWQIGD